MIGVPAANFRTIPEESNNALSSADSNAENAATEFSDPALSIGLSQIRASMPDVRLNDRRPTYHDRWPARTIGSKHSGQSEV